MHDESIHRSVWQSAVFEDEVLATALLDRLLHHAEVLNINGRSYRMKDRFAADVPHPA